MRTIFGSHKQAGHRMKKAFTFLFAVACLCLFGCKEKAKNSPSSASENPLTAPVDYIGAVGKAQQTAQKNLSSLGLDQAIRAFYAEENRFPTNLNELVTKGSLTELPPAPRGMKFSYDPTSGALKVVPQ